MGTNSCVAQGPKSGIRVVGVMVKIFQTILVCLKKWYDLKVEQLHAMYTEVENYYSVSRLH